MLRVGISQRVDEVSGYGERRDALDQQWVSLLERMGFLGVPLPNGWNDPVTAVRELGLDGAILSGGNDLASLKGATNVAPERDRLESALLDISLREDFPLFGVCRGMQMMGDFLGAKLVPLNRNAHVAKNHALLGTAELPSRDEVNSFHGWGFNTVPDELVELARTELGGEVSIEAFRHRSAPMMAIMWHPERDPFDPRDQQLIQKFFSEKSKP